MLDATALAALRDFDTPTVCNALEILAPERRGHGFTRRPLVCARPALPPIVGFARTATIRAAEPSGRDAAGERDMERRYYRHVAAGPFPSVTVIQDLDPEPGLGAWWGEVHTHVHRGLGSVGCITNGSVRDLDQLAEGFQVLAGSVGPSHAHVHVVDVDLPVEVQGMPVSPGDLLHADRHGAVVVPEELAKALPDAAREVIRAERLLIEASREPGFDIDALLRLTAGDRH